MLKRIKVTNYKSFKSLEVKLTPLAVIFGPNASGKSNFLDAVYLLSRLVSSKNLKEAFDGHRGLPLESFFYTDGGYEGLLRRERVQMSFEVDVKLSEPVCAGVSRLIAEKRKGFEAKSTPRKVITERFLRYSLTVEALPATGILRVVEERLAALRPDGQEKKRHAFLERMPKEGRDMLHLRVEGQGHPTYHEIGLDHTVISTALYEPHYPHITAFRTELEGWHIFYLEPKTLMREEVPLAEIRRIGPRGDNLAAFLNTLKHDEERAFDNLGLSLHAVLPRVTRLDVERTKEGRVGLQLWEDDTPYSARLVSEGTLRILGLLSALHPRSAGSLIGYEEPENGVHPARLRQIADLLKTAANDGKQVIVTTHSPIFPGYFDNRDLFVCSKRGPTSDIKPFDSFPGLWRQGKIDDALEDSILRGDFGA